MPPAVTDTQPARHEPFYEPFYEKLPARGRRTALDRDAVASNQPSRLIGAIIEDVAERGYAGVRLARLVARWRGRRPGDPRVRGRALIFRVGDPGTLAPRTPLR
jgi:hypothetical protein